MTTTYSYVSINASYHRKYTNTTCANSGCGYTSSSTSTIQQHSWSSVVTSIDYIDSLYHNVTTVNTCTQCNYSKAPTYMTQSHYFDPEEFTWTWYNYSVHYCRIRGTPCLGCEHDIDGTWYQGHIDDGTSHCVICGGSCSGGGGGGGCGPA